MAVQIRFQPTLVIFLGTSSGQIGWRLKKLLAHAYGYIPILRFLWIDIDTAIGSDEQRWFDPGERIELSGFDPAVVVKNVDNYPAIKEWWSQATVIRTGMLAGGGSPQQKRTVGRLALFRKFNDRMRGPAFIDKLNEAVNSLFEIGNHAATEARSTDKIKYTVEPGCRVVLVHSTCGGTGSAISFDVAYLCRSLLAGKNPTVISVSILPSVIDKAIKSETTTQREKVRANTYAWFIEDNYLSENPYWNVQYPEGAPTDVVAPPFDYRFVVDIENQAGYRLDSVDDIYNMIAHALFLDTGSSIAGAMRGFTANVAALGENFEGILRAYSSLAAAALIYPKERLLTYCSSRMGRAILTEGLLGAPSEQEVAVAASTLLAQLRLRDAELLDDLMESTRVTMHYETAIAKAASVAAAITQVDSQESQNQTHRRAAIEKLAAIHAARLLTIQDCLDKEVAHIAAARGFSFAQAVLDLLMEPSPGGQVEPNVISLAGLKARISQQGASEANLGLARSDYEEKRKALKSLDDGFEDVIERKINPGGWKKKFTLFKRDCVNAMNKINDLTVQIAAQQQAATIYDQLASKSSELDAQLAGAITSINTAAKELQATVDRLGSKSEAESNSFEFQQEIEVNFADAYWERSAHIQPQAVFQSMIPARVTESLETLCDWVNERIKTSAKDYARQFFQSELEETSLLSTLQAAAEKRGEDPQTLVRKYLDKLVEYCHPFWVYDQNRGLSDMEGKSIIGVEDENSPLLPETYRNNPLYEIKTTGFPDRIEVVRVQHGLPAFLLKGMNEYKSLYELKRKTGNDLLHVLPGMEFAPDLIPLKGIKNRDLFALGLAFGYIVQSGAWYYFDPERGYQTHKIPPGKEFRLAQGREKSEEVFSRREAWVKKVDDMVELDVRQMGNAAAIQKLEQAIETHKAAIARMPANDESLRKQYEKEVKAFNAMQRQLGKVD